MRKLGIYAIKDISGNSYNQPFFQPTQVHAVRVFRTEINRADPQNLLYLYPQEFELHELGQFNEENGQIELEQKRLCNGAELKLKT